MKYLSIFNYRLRLYVCVFVFLLVGCNSAQETKRTVEVNGEPVTRIQLEEIVGDIFHDSAVNRKFRRWQHTDEEIFCRVIGLDQTEIILFQNIFENYMNKTNLNIDGCHDPEKGAVQMIYIYSHDLDTLIQFPLTQSLFGAADIEQIKDNNGTLTETKLNIIDGLKYTVFSTTVATLSQDEDINNKFKRLIIISIIQHISVVELLKYDDSFINTFISSYYAIEHTPDLVYEGAIPKISDMMFEQLLKR